MLTVWRNNTMMIKRATGRISQFSTELEENMELKNPQDQPVLATEEETKTDTFTAPGLVESEDAE